MKRISMLSGGLLVSAAALAQGSRPNVVFIVADDQNTNTIGCYNPNVSTPNIDALGANGIKFENANVVSSISSASRYNLLTGRYYNNSYSKEFLGMYPKGKPSCINNFMVLEPDNRNLGGLLQKAGYTTGFVGKCHLFNHQLEQNNKLWEQYGLQTYPSDSDPRIDKETDRKMHENHRLWCSWIKNFGFDYVNGLYAANLRELFNQYANAHNVEWTMDAAIKFLDAQKGSDKPFFLYMATTYPHGPAPERVENGKYVASIDADVSITGEGVVEGLDGYFDREEIKRQYEKLKKENPQLDRTAAPALWWDASVGQVVKKLREMGVEDNTLIVYISDHGVYRGGKTTLYEDGVNVPMVMQWKKGIPAGIKYPYLVGSIDIAATIYDVCGVDAKKAGIDGVSLAPIFKNPDKPVRDALLLEMGYARAIKTDDYKYIAVRYPDKPETRLDKKTKLPYLILHGQLAERSASARPNYFVQDQVYDYKADRSENDNLYGKDPRRDEELKKLLGRELRKFPHRPFGEFNTKK